MANSVYHLNGGTGSIFDLYDYNVFETTTLLDGLIYNEGRKTVTINIRTNVVKNIYGKIDSKKDDVFASEEDLFNMQSDLSTQTYFRFVKEDINMYVRSVNDSYELYIAVTENNRDRALKSLANAIKILKPNVYATIVDENGNINFSPDSTDYQMNANVTFSEAGIYQTNDSILEIVINK